LLKIKALRSPETSVPTLPVDTAQHPGRLESSTVSTSNRQLPRINSHTGGSGQHVPHILSTLVRVLFPMRCGHLYQSILFCVQWDTKYTVFRGGCTIKLMKFKLQNPSLAQAPSKALSGWGASNVFTWPYVFVKFTYVIWAG